MERSLRRYIIYIGLIGVLVGLFCGCGKQTEKTPPLTDADGMQGGVMTGTKAPADTTTQAPTDTAGLTVTPSEGPTNMLTPTPTSTPVPTSTPTPMPVITDPYDGRFWIGKYAEDTELLLTKGQIKEQNEKQYHVSGTKLAALSERIVYTAGEVLGMIEEYSLPSRKYFDNREFGASEKERLLQERNLSALRENAVSEILPEYGILISNTDMRSFPTKKRLTSEIQGRFDYLQETRLLIGEAVLVLHRSEDGEWCFVQAENYCGWISEAAIAYCTRDEFCTVTDTMAAIECAQIVVVTKNGNYRIGERNIYLRMGTRFLSGAAGRQDEENGQSECVGDGVIIKVPCRDDSSRLVWETVSVTCVDAEGDVCFVNGYLPYTRANIMQLAVSLLGTPYAWGDAPSFGADVAEAGDNGMDCSSTVSAVFRCFGFVLPRNTGTQRKMDCEKQEMAAFGEAQRKEALDQLQGGELLYTSGHVMLYLGKTDGEYYVLHNTSTESRDDGGLDEFYRCVITTMRLGKSGQTILERLIQRNTLFP